MRYAYDHKAIEYINRVENAQHGHPGDMKAIDASGGKHLAALLWIAADERVQWEDTDIAWEILPALQKCWDITLEFDKFQTPSQMRAECAYNNAVEDIADVENRIYLATCVVNAITALEGGIDLIWHHEEKTDRVWGDQQRAIGGEFAKEREAAKNKARWAILQEPLFASVR